MNRALKIYLEKEGYVLFEDRVEHVFSLSYKGRIARSPTRYNVGIVCALPLELLAVWGLFDLMHKDDDRMAIHSDDSNHYALGEMDKHKVAAACLPDGKYGTNPAADVAANMRRTFPSVKFALLVGIGGGVPSLTNDIRLGDVVASRPTGIIPGVIQYDMGRVQENGTFTQAGFLHAPPRLIMTTLSKLRSDPSLPATPLQEHLDESIVCRREYRYPGKDRDKLFSSEYLESRAHRPDSNDNHHPCIHYGTIASGNRVVRDAKMRDFWGKQSNILCFEMEAVGIMDTIPCLVIRGICDYSDSHKNKRL
ncbi:purine and uridine phosphorylase [Aspergillus varians]